MGSFDSQTSRTAAMGFFEGAFKCSVVPHGFPLHITSCTMSWQRMVWRRGELLFPRLPTGYKLYKVVPWNGPLCRRGRAAATAAATNVVAVRNARIPSCICRYLS